LAAAVADDKAEPLGRVVPLDRAALLHRRLEHRAVGARCETSGPRRARHGASGAGIDAEHFGHLRPALALADAHLERVAGLDRGDPVASEYGRMQERIARAVRQLDEAEALFAFEPLD